MYLVHRIFLSWCILLCVIQFTEAKDKKTSAVGSYIVGGALSKSVNAAATAPCSPNPNAGGPPFVDGCPLPASGLNNLIGISGVPPVSNIPIFTQNSNGFRVGDSGLPISTLITDLNKPVTPTPDGTYGCPTVTISGGVPSFISNSCILGQIVSVSLSSTNVIKGPTGTIVGAVTVGINPSQANFGGSLSVTGANASSFQIIGNNLAINGTVNAGNYNINIVASQSGMMNSPFTQAFAIQVQEIATVALSDIIFTGQQPSGFVVGDISVTMNPALPVFSGNLSITGADASSYQIVGSQLATNTTVANGNYSINIVATQGVGSLSQPFSLSAIPQTIVSSALLNNSFVGGTGSANNRVGTVNVVLSPTRPLFFGTISITGTDAGNFTPSNGNIYVHGTNVAAGSYSINVVATQGGNTLGSPSTSPQTITGLTAQTIQVPGPSKQLYDRPYYTCSRDFYVSTAGNDTNSGTSPFAPWKTIAHADASGRLGGDCINVAPGTYSSFNSALQFGGSTASTTGYVTYRCTAPGFIGGTGCLVTGVNPIAAGTMRSGVFPNYLIFDGFNLVNPTQTVATDSAVACAGPGTFGQAQTVSMGCHHWIIVNNILTGHGQAGVSMGDTEFTYTTHNLVSQNSHQGCVGFFGSGIAYVVAKPLSGYSKTADDTNANNNLSLNWMGIQGTTFPFNQVAAWNEVVNNYQGCQSLVNATDGNGIIIDTFNITACNANQIDYPNSTLVAFNVTYNNGGGGVHVFASANVTVANNSAYQNVIDPTLNAFVRPNIDVQCGASISGFGENTDLIVNNLSYAIPDSLGCGGNNMGAQNPFNVGGGGIFVDANYNTPGKNITFSLGTPCNTNPATGISQFQVPPNLLWDCSANKCFTDPLWVDVGRTTGGSKGVPPVGKNFALCVSNGSPAGCTGASPAISAGATETYLPAQSIDAGACSSTLATCP